jgi:hypothetical protein
MPRRLKLATGALIAAATAGAAALPAASSADHPGPGHGDHHNVVQHVLLISVDGLHQSDLDWYVANHPGSELAKLANGGADYANAHTSDPSDSSTTTSFTRRARRLAMARPEQTSSTTHLTTSTTRGSTPVRESLVSRATPARSCR